MDKMYFTEEHDFFRKSFQDFLQKEVVPHIEKWEETNAADQNDTLRLKTTAVKLKRLRTPYWQQNKNKHSFLRDSLGLTN